MSSHLMAALESAVTESAKEVEYCYFVRLTQEQMDALSTRYKEARRKVFSESKLMFNEELGISGRLRHYRSEQGDTFELTSKQRTDEARAKTESNIELDKLNYEMLLASAKSTVVRIRMFIPYINQQGEPVLRKSGDALTWEIDLYLDSRNLTQDNPVLHPWVKVEMEVDKATAQGIDEHIPFDYEELIHSDSDDEHDQAFIKNLYENDYNVRGKLKRDTLSTLDEL